MGRYLGLGLLGWFGFSQFSMALANAVSTPPPSLQEGLIWLVLIVIGTVVGDRLIVQGFAQMQPWLEKQIESRHYPWLDLGWSLLRWLLRLALWIAGLVGILLLPAAAPLQQWLLSIAIPLQTGFNTLLAIPLFTLGREKFTLSALLVFFTVTLAVILLSRWFSGWLKRRVLARLRLDRGSQEAIAGVTGYLLAALGLIIVLQTIGIDLSSLAVLAGVLGIGLGFGFQLLASNFISGLAILVEQPIKVGDFIEVDGLLGTVEKVSIRSTVLRTNDNLCVIVPNNRFLEKNVVNWSYANPESRVHVPVGVAFGSDTVLVTEALLTAARQEPRVLPHPSPSVWFKRFGDSAYEFELLVWINKPQDYEPIKSALNFLIEQELSSRGIEIPFPQRELRVRHLEELHPLLSREAGGLERSLSANPIAPEQTLRVLLRKVSFFTYCTDPELRVLIERGYQKLIPASQVIFYEHEPGDSFYIILAGEVEVVSSQLQQLNDAVSSSVIAKLQKGDFFGEISLLAGVPRSATVRAVVDTILFVVDRPALQKLLQDHQELAEQIASELAQRQQVLRELGLLSQDGINPGEVNPLQWMRQRLQTLFCISQDTKPNN